MKAFYVFLALLSFPSSLWAAVPQKGHQLVKDRCGGCHSVERSGVSPNPKAPDFRKIAQQWPVEQLQEALAEGIVTGHAEMPEFVFEPHEIEDILAYLRKLRGKKR